MAYALDGAPNSTSIVLITGDRDFAYAVAFLRMRGYPVTVIGPVKHSASLFAHASSKIDWSTICQGVVPLDLGSAPKTPPSRPPLLPSANFINTSPKTSTFGAVQKPAVAASAPTVPLRFGNPYFTSPFGLLTPSSPPVSTPNVNKSTTLTGLATSWAPAASPPGSESSGNDSPPVRLQISARLTNSNSSFVGLGQHCVYIRAGLE